MGHQVRVLGLAQERRVGGSRVKTSLFRKVYIPYTECGLSQKARVARGIGLLVFMGWVISYANEWEEYSCCSRRKGGDF